MTNNEIIEALKICSTIGASCKDCPAFVKDNHSNCKEVLLGAITLIDRQRSEIERLQKEVNLVSIQFQDIQERQEESQAEIERLNEVYQANQQLINALNKSYFLAKAEAYKECIEKVKNYIKTHCNPYGKPDFDYDTSIKILNFIDNLSKEIVSGDN